MYVYIYYIYICMHAYMCVRVWVNPEPPDTRATCPCSSRVATSTLTDPATGAPILIVCHFASF